MTAAQLNALFDKLYADYNSKPSNIIKRWYNNCMEIKIISPKYGNQTLLIDEEDVSHITGTLFLSKAGQFLYVRVQPFKKYLHRLIMNAPKGMVVDHKNRNTLDNRKVNLQVVTIQQNLRNQKRPNNKTGYTGVAIGWKGKYTAQIERNYKKIHIGTFNTIEEAYEARKKAEVKYWNI